MAIPFNSILNDSWYNRLRAKVTEGANQAIRNTNSRPNDPFWQARAQQEQGDLANQRQDAIRSLYESSAASRSQDQAQEAARQRRISMGLAAQVKPDTYMTPQGAEGPAQGPQNTAEFNIQKSQPMPAPNIPQLPGPSAAPFMPYKPYNPGQFDNPLLNRRKKRLSDWQAKIGSTPIY